MTFRDKVWKLEPIVKTEPYPKTNECAKSLTKDTNSIYSVLSLDSDYVLTLGTQLSRFETMAGDSVDFELFRYNPNIGAAILFIVLFTAASILHT